MEDNKNLTKIIVTIPTAAVIVWGAICYKLGTMKGKNKEHNAYIDGVNDGVNLYETVQKDVLKNLKKEEK